ncbi:MAG: Gfo/Idh/MocA family oxidoreductase [Balneolales bacterium]
MSQKKCGIGIVGCGNISGTHADAINHSRNGELVAAFSRNSEKLNTYCNKYSTNGFTDYDEFLAQSDIDIVSICTPSGTHLDFGIKAAEAGKHVIVEKPIEVNLERGRKLIDICKKNKVRLAVIFQSRFMDDIIRMKKAIDEGQIGKPFMVSASVKWYRDQEYYTQSPWRGSLALDGGGAVINQSIHTVDLLQWLTGGVEKIYALKGTFTHEGIEGEDNAVACLNFKNGAIGIFEASTSIDPPQNRKIEIHGTKGTALLEGSRYRYLSSENDSSEEQDDSALSAAGAASPLSDLSYEDHRKQYEQIVDAFSNNTDLVVSGEESLKSLAIVEALYTSAEKNEPVTVEE